MNKFGTRDMQRLIDSARKAATEEGRSEEDKALFADIADTLENADGYFCAVEAACI